MDQTDVLAQNERLSGELADARTALEVMTTERDALTRRLAETNTAHEAALQQAQAAHQTLQQALDTATAERERLAAVDRDFNRRLAQALTQHGIRPEGVEAGANGKVLDLVAQYEAISDHTERAAFLAKHATELRSLVR